MIGDVTGLELRLLDYFRTLCKELNFTRASEVLGISQPTLSHQIRLLEDRLRNSTISSNREESVYKSIRIYITRTYRKGIW